LWVRQFFLALSTLLLVVGSGLGWQPSETIHLATVGAIGCTSIGMMVRVSLGHTGRPLHVNQTTIGALGLMILAALLRFAAPTLTTGNWPQAGYVAAGICWILALFLFLVQFTSLLYNRAKPHKSWANRIG